MQVKNRLKKARQRERERNRKERDTMAQGKEGQRGHKLKFSIERHKHK